MTNNPKLLFVAPSYYVLSGLASWLDYILPGLEKRGYSCWLGLVAGEHHKVAAYLESHPYKKVVVIENATGTEEGRIRALEKTFRTVQPDVILSVNIPDSIRAAGRYRKGSSKPAHAVMTIHGLEADLVGDAKILRDSMDGVICTNKLTCKIIEQMAGFSAERVHYAPYGVSAVRLENRPSKIENTRPYRIGLVGRIEQSQKRVLDIPAIVEALNKSSLDFELWMVGTGPDEERLRNSLNSDNSQQRVKFVGFVLPEEMDQKAYNQIDALLLTSSWETGPIVIWEALNHGIPVVTSQYVGCGLEGSLENGHNCLMFEIGDTKGAAQCILKLQDTHLVKALAKAGKELIEQRYSEERSVDAWHMALKNILGKKPLLSSVEFKPKPAGRLDRWCGVRFAETIRQTLSLQFRHSGSHEWPHTLSGQASDEAYWNSVRELDRVR